MRIDAEIQDKRQHEVNHFASIVEKHASEISYLWTLRSAAFSRPQFWPKNIKKIESRIEKHFKGLMNFPDDAWKLCLQSMKYGQAGEAFTLAVLAFHSLDVSKIQVATDLGMVDDQRFRGLTSALGWLPEKISQQWGLRFLNSNDLNHRYLALAVHSILRSDPGERLTTLFKRGESLDHKPLYMRALRLVGELKRFDLMQAVNSATDSDDQGVIFWASRSALLIGNRAAVNQLKPIVLTKGPYQQRAIDIVFRALPVAHAREWISELSKDDAQVRRVIQAIGVLGDPSPINWLLVKMNEPLLVRIAGEAFSLITGIDLKDNDLTDEWASRGEQSPDNEYDLEDIHLSDEKLPWPDAEKVTVKWRQHEGAFVAGQRFFLGKLIVTEHLKVILATGCQPHRSSAALEWALLDSRQPLINTQAKLLEGSE